MNDISGRLKAALAGRYTIERELGAGGMATVYLAQDLKHDRQVAIKVLRPELAAVLGAERFVQEIKTTAALQHPNILPLFDSGQADGFLYYVMPYVEGETLRARLNRETQLGVDEAVKLTIEVAEALDYAHRHGVIHRDIKPENILLHDGRPLVADFGIALAVSAAAGGRMTETGLSLGTPHYMSPEQATADKDITARSDVYSLASVLYEMLAGQPPHLGGSAQQIIMKIIAEPVPLVTTLRKSVPPNVTAALGKALEKLPADRFESAKAFAEALTNPNYRTAATAALASPTAGPPYRRSAPLLAALVLATALAAWGWLRPRASAPSGPLVEFSLDPPDSTMLFDWPAFAPDGRRIVVLGSTNQKSALYERLLDARGWRMIPGTEGANTGAFLSPDGRWMGFGTKGGAIKRVPVNGGAAQTITQLTSSGIYGATWGPDNTVVFSAFPTDTQGAQTLFRVSADGGVPERLTALRGVGGGQVVPHYAPRGDILFFEIIEGSRTSLAALALRSGKVARLGPGMSPQTVQDGRLVYVTADSLAMVQSFDPSTLRLEGPPRRVAAGIDLYFGVVGVFAVSPAGGLVYRTGIGGSDLMLVDRSGRSRPLYSGSHIWNPRFSPSGDRIAFIRTEGSSDGDIWMYSLADGSVQRLTSDAHATDPAWSHDGRWIGYSTTPRDASYASLYRMRSDGSGSVEPLLAGAADYWQMSFGPGDRELVFYANGDVWRATVGSHSAPTPLLKTDAQESDAAISPDGGWIVYTSNETGITEVYTRSYPGLGPRTAVSVGGGGWPVWSADGRQIFYWGSNRLIAATVRAEGSRMTVADRTELFDTRPFRTEANRNYDVAPSGREFVMVGGAGSSRLVVRIGALGDVDQH
jgi:Tol biopolymer transport system component